jgi:hypothetical protein
MKPRTARTVIAFGLLAASLSCGGSDGGGTTGPTPNPVPTLTSLSRDTAMAGATPFVIVLRGTDFVPGISATIGGVARTTVRASDTVATVQTVAADLATATTREVRVINPEPGGGTSDALTLTIHPAPPVPVIDSLSPDSAVQGGAALTVRLHGAGFTPKTTVRWNAGILATTYVSASRIDASVPAGNLVSVLTAEITAVTPAPGGGTSGIREFEVVPPPPPPLITGASVDTFVIDPTPINITLFGLRFADADSVLVANQGAIHWYGAEAVTDTSLTFELDRSWIASLGDVLIRVRSPLGLSPSYGAIEAINPVPEVTSLSKDTLDGTKLADTLIIHGSGFVTGMGVSTGYGLAMSAQALDFNQMRVVVPHETMLRGGSVHIRVVDSWDDRESDSLLIHYKSPVPTVDSITVQPNFGSDSVGSSGMAFIAWGRDLALTGHAVVDGVEIPSSHPATTFSGFIVDSSFMTAPDTLMLAYKNPTPGGGVSAAFPFIVRSPNAPPVIDSVAPAVARSDSGTQTLAFHGHGFVPGTIVGPQPYSPDSTWPLDESFPTVVVDSTKLLVTIPTELLTAGNVYTLQAQAPQPTARPSEPVRVPVWTTGVRSVEVASSGPLAGLAVDTLRSTIYATRGTRLLKLDPATGAAVDSLTLPGSGTRIYLSNNAELAFVAVNGGNRVSRVDLDTWTLLGTVDMGTWELGGDQYPRVATRVFPSEVDPASYVIADGTSFYYDDLITYGYRLRTFDADIERPVIDTVWTSVVAGRFFGDTLVVATQNVIHRMVLDSAGVHRVDSIATSVIGDRGLFLRRDRLSTPGLLIDATTGTIIHQHTDLGGTAAMGTATDRFFTARPSAISAIDLATGTTIRTIGFNAPDTPRFAVTTAQRFFLAANSLLWNVTSVLTDP